MQMIECDHHTIDQHMRSWRQGDCVVGEQWFLFRTGTIQSLTESGTDTVSKRANNAEMEVSGFAVMTQTCDLVRKCSERPFVEVSPLVEVNTKILHEIERGRRPNYAFIPNLAKSRLVIDLDRVMTVEKSVVVTWTRTQGCMDDNDTRRLSFALARKRARTAFPDDFILFANPLVRRMLSKHEKKSDEGEALRMLREIRVRAAPSWEAHQVRLTFWFIRDEEELTIQEQAWDSHLCAWLKRIPPSNRFITVDGILQTLDDLTAREYVESDPLDLDHLST